MGRVDQVEQVADKKSCIPKRIKRVETSLKNIALKKHHKREECHSTKHMIQTKVGDEKRRCVVRKCYEHDQTV